MPLSDILVDIAMTEGQVTSASEKAARIYRVNKAAREINKRVDTEEANREEVYDLNVSSQQVALPAYVDRVRGMRYFDGRQAVPLAAMQNRYNFNYAGENELWYLQFRKKESTILCREISNQSVIAVRVPLPNEEAFTVTLTGKTDKSERVSETLSFSATDLEKVTASNFIAVESAVKNKITKYNIGMFDVEENLLGEILNSEFKSVYQIYQLADTEGFTMPVSYSGVEVLFKYKFQPFKFDDDCFMGTDKYDDAIVWKYLENNSRDADDAKAYRAKCDMLLNDLASDDQAGQRTKINFQPNAYVNMPYTYYARRPFRY